MTRPVLSLDIPPARFPRTRTGVAPQPLLPLTSWLQEAARAAAVGLLVALLWALAKILA